MVISLTDFNTLTEQEKKETLQDLKNQIGVSGIANTWGISRSKTYSILSKLNIPLNSKGRKSSKTKTVSAEGAKNVKNNIKENQPNQTSLSTTDPKKNKTQTSLKKPVTPESSWELDIEDNVSKFSLYLETQGTTPLICETLQMLLGSEKFADSNLHINLTLQEI